MRIKRQKKKRDYVFFILKAALLISVIYLCVNFFYSRIRPMVITAAGNQARVVVTNALNKAITEELSKNEIKYADIVSVSRNSDGLVTSIETNTVSANFFKARILSVVLTQLRSIEQQSLLIPAGSLSDIPFFFGKGPDINFKITTSGVADAKFESEFTSAGINQTCHRIKLVVTADIYALIPGFASSAKLSTDYYIAETIIVGVTPDFFADIG